MAASVDPATRRVWVGSIVFDRTEFDRMFAFGREALHDVPHCAPTPGWVVATDPLGRGPNVSLDLAREPHLADDRLHLDLDATDALPELDRLVVLGAKVIQDPQAGHDYVTLADPEGNRFDLVDVNGPDDTLDWEFGRKP